MQRGVQSATHCPCPHHYNTISHNNEQWTGPNCSLKLTLYLLLTMLPTLITAQTCYNKWEWIDIRLGNSCMSLKSQAAFKTPLNLIRYNLSAHEAKHEKLKRKKRSKLLLTILRAKEYKILDSLDLRASQLLTPVPSLTNTHMWVL